MNIMKSELTKHLEDMMDSLDSETPLMAIYDKLSEALVMSREYEKRSKRLSKAETAAEMWHAKYFMLYSAVRLANGEQSFDYIVAAKKQLEKAEVWDRFNTHPHAIKED